MWLLRELAGGTYELVCEHEEKLCKSIGVIFLFAAAKRLFSAKSSATQAIHASVLPSASTVSSTGMLFETG